MAMLVLMSLANAAHAAFITIDEAGLDAVFSQAVFGNNTIDIRIGPAVEHVDPNLLNMDSLAKWNTLNGNHYGGVNTVNFWFLDDLTWCGNINVNYVGCGDLPGNDFVVESVFASGPNNAELLAHELGHNLNLAHRNGVGNLMDPTINGGIGLNDAEVATILASNLVQTDANNRLFINILPVLIVAEATPDIPEPETLTLMLLSLMFLVRKRVSK